VLRGVWAFPAIMLDESGVKIACYTALMQVVISFTHEYVNVMKRLH